jgi:hypothetical protein
MKGWKTVLFNAVMVVIALVTTLNPDAEKPDAAAVQGAIDTGEAAFATIWGVGNVILRALTNSPIFKKE